MEDSSSPTRDIMNDPDFNPSNDDGNNDADTCRICRGEAAENEPLFYPCKCSGSIKFVHQDCLMEWLSHSQKKHCELCKTPFRFTKLYSPHMPQKLPASVFARHLAVSMARNMTTWLRLSLVVAVWLGILPFTIRQFWRFIFWFSDGGWPPSYPSMGAAHNASIGSALEIAHEIKTAALSGNGTSPASPFLASHTSPARMGGLVNKMAGYLTPFSVSLNMSAVDPLTAGFIKSLYFGFGLQSTAAGGQLNSTMAFQYLKNLSTSTPRTSLLSEVSFLKNMTRSSTINSIAITISEGYIITFSVVISFILVFLIREWVVQQQPGINMGAGFDAEFPGQGRRRNREPRVVPAAVDIPNIEEGARGIEQRDVRRPRRRLRLDDQQAGGGQDARPADNREGNLPGNALATHADAQAGPGEPSASYRPTLPGRDALDPAADLQRRLTEEPKMTREFLDIWQRAGANPVEVLRLIELEGLNEDMAYWVSAMKILQVPDAGSVDVDLSFSKGRPEKHRRRSIDAAWSAQATDSGSANRSRASSDTERNSSESWVDIPASNDDPMVPDIEENRDRETRIRSSHRDKGKGKENQGVHLNPVGSAVLNEDLATSQSSVPASLFDQPESRTKIYPESSWSFSNLPTPAKSSWDDEVPKDDVRDTFPQQEDKDWQSEQDGHVQRAIPRDREPDRALLRHRKIKSTGSDLEDTVWATSSTTSGQSASFESNQSTRGFEAEPVPQNWAQIVATDSTPASIASNEILEDHRLGAEQELDIEQAEDAHRQDVLPPPAAVARPVEPPGILGQVADWLWARPGIELHREEVADDDEQVVQDIAAEAPFVPRGIVQQDILPELQPQIMGPDVLNQDREVVAAALAAGLDPNDPDAVDEAEDFDGIMELVGMRGPLPGLLQNALFSAFLVALAVAIGVWIPYNIGRVTLLLAANPVPAFKLPIRLLFGCAAFLQDAALAFLGSVAYVIVFLGHLPFRAIFYFTDTANKPLAENLIGLSTKASGIAQTAFDHGMSGTINGLVNILESDFQTFSAASHESLLLLRSTTTASVAGLGANVRYIFTGDYHLTASVVLFFCQNALLQSWHFISNIPEVLLRPESWVISLEIAERATPLDPTLSVWGSCDRFWATFAGYTTLSVIGILYVNKGSPFSEGQVGREWEAAIIDLLHQAGGVMKVILIISIEMLAFPLYCGLLLDLALLPLFENATVMSRILFTIRSPLTSIFVHWFVGTCYMFHFALFVSMCRKIMRKGVLYFIRDPDDPTFHPVRDVLERNVATQLRKILFSALVYGALVVVCLGGVVWGIYFAFDGVLPIHWSSNEPVLEFPIDLLFYNFLMPLAVRFFKPSDGLHIMYTWWFRRCARMLRLTWFMFDERRRDEEGHYADESWSHLFSRTAEDWFSTEPSEAILPGENFIKDGRYVRTPASDQVRIPKGQRVFLEVTENNDRIDGATEGRAVSPHAKENPQFKQVYVPPYFRVRIFLFIFSIWLFAAVTGVGITVVPLVFGRRVFSWLLPAHVSKNDVYAFSIGIYILGTILYALLHLQQSVQYLREVLSVNSSTPRHLITRLRVMSTRVASVVWTYAAILFLLPTLSALLVEFYILIPMHTYFAVDEPHVVHFVQSWTLGLLYVKLTTRLILWYENSRPAQALRAVTRNGYLNPDARLATRSFIFPLTVVLGFLLGAPWVIASLACKSFLKQASSQEVKVIFRYAYPMMFAVVMVGVACWTLIGVVRGWKQRIKDEVYLIGERLHNFGDNKKGTNSVSIPALQRMET
ncbi:E3 ubiquitin-protein ligase march6 [Phlyctema vagabunda]|uniref:RING-type E3 ubiquitin transferase n=1 Tax=Phlyctema vagabunda TaxID=108571 RepID=A0ABR4P2C8_9HELO